MGKLDGKVALISGGARGQGAAEAETFAREGAKVVFGDVRDDEGKKVEAAIRAAGGDALYLHVDVTSEADWKAAWNISVSTGPGCTELQRILSLACWATVTFVKIRMAPLLAA